MFLKGGSVLQVRSKKNGSVHAVQVKRNSDSYQEPIELNKIPHDFKVNHFFQLLFREKNGKSLIFIAKLPPVFLFLFELENEESGTEFLIKDIQTYWKRQFRPEKIHDLE